MLGMITPFALLCINGGVVPDLDFTDLDQNAKLGDVKTDVRLRSSVMIKANKNLVWLSIHEYRTNYEELVYAKVLFREGPTSIIEQQFAVARLGKATCTFLDTDCPPDKITYQLLKSNLFSAMDGSWVMTPIADGKSTRLDLYCHAGIQGKVPRFLLRFGLSRSLKKRLESVKRAAEKKALTTDTVGA